MKNIYIFFKNSKKSSLKNCVILDEYNLFQHKNNSIWLFYFVVENFLFIVTLNNSIFIYTIDFNMKKIYFLKRTSIKNFHFNHFNEILLMNLNKEYKGTCENDSSSETEEKSNTNKANIETSADGLCNKTDNNIHGDEIDNISKNVKQSTHNTQLGYLKYNYCLILKSLNKIELVSLNIFDDSHIEIKVSNAENLLKYNNNTFNQYYISSLNFKYNFLNIKQMYYQNKNIYTMIKNELKKTCTQNDEHMLNDKEHTWSYEQHPKNYEHTNNKNIHYDVINLSFKKYIELKKKNIINVHFIYTRENNIIVFICVPKNIDNTLIHVADTKKYTMSM